MGASDTLKTQPDKRSIPLWKQGWARALVTIGLLVWLFRSLDWSEVIRLTTGIRWGWALAACGVYSFNRWLTTFKWWVLLHAKGLRYPIRQLLRVVFVSNFLGHFLPASVGGDNIRMLTMAKESARAPEAISTVVMERITGSASLGLLAVLGGLWSYGRWGQPAVALAIILPVLALLVTLGVILTTPGYRLVSTALSRLRKVPGQAFISKVHEATQSFRHEPLAVWIAFGVSCLIQVNRVLCIYLLARSIGTVLFFGEALVLVPTALFIGALPISIAGLGVRESAFVVLLGLAGLQKPEAFGLSILSRLAALASNLPGAFFLMRHGLSGKTGVEASPAADNGPIRVLRVSDKLGYGANLHGPGRQWLTSLGVFDSRRVQVVPCVLRLDPHIRSQFANQGIELIDLNKRSFDPMTITALCGLIRKHKIQMVHLSGYGATTFGRIAAVITGIPAITHHHDTDDGMPGYVQAMDRWLAPVTARAVAISSAVAEACARKRFIRPKRIVVIPNAILPNWATLITAETLRSLREQLGIPEGLAVIGSLTRLRKEKDIFTFLRAIGRLRDKGWTGYAVIVGDGPDNALVKQQIQDLGLQDRVKLAGFQADVRPWLALMQVAVFSSRTEGFCNALLEAMAMGRPVVATSAGGMKELLTDGRNGIMVPVGDDGALAGGIERLLSDSRLAERLGAQAQVDAQAFLVPAMVAKFEAVYEQVAQQHRSGALIGASGAAVSFGAGLREQAQEQASSKLPRALWVTDKIGEGEHLHDIGLYYLSVLPYLKETAVVPVVLRSNDALMSQLTRVGLQPRLLNHGRFDMRTLPVLLGLIRRERITVLHVHGYGSSTFGRLAGRIARIPVVVHQHDNIAEVPWYVRLADRFFSPWTAQVIAVSESVKQTCIEERSMPADRVVVWHNAVALPNQPLDARSTVAMRQKLGLPVDRLIVGTIARLTPDKGLRLLIEAAAQVRATKPKITFAILGEGPEQAALEQAVARLGIQEQVLFLKNSVARDAFLAALDCFVSSSVIEGSPFELLEAMGAGLPIVATAVGGTVDLLAHDRTAWLVPSRDPRSLAEGICSLLEDEHLRARLGSAAQEAASAYDIDHYARRLESLYRQLDYELYIRAPRTGLSQEEHSRTLFRYTVVGAFGLVIHFCFLWFLVERASCPLLLATTVGFVAAAANNLLWNRVWTFASSRRHTRIRVMRFLVVTVAGFVINTLSMAVLVFWDALPYLLAQMITEFFITAWNFLANTYWTFQPIRFSVPAPAAGSNVLELSIVIPAFNEAKRLPSTIDAVAAYVKRKGLRAEMIVINDGSTDETLAVATQMPVEGVRLRVIHYEVNRGKGSAVRAGLLAAQGEYILMTDADNSIPIEGLDDFWPQRDPMRVLIGSRYVRTRGRQAGVPLVRYWIGRVGNAIIQFFLLPGIRDTQCGFKLFGNPVAKALAARQRILRFGFDMELLAIAKALGVDIREVQVNWKHAAGSRVRPARDAVNTLEELMKIKANLWRGLYHTRVRVEMPQSASGLSPR